MLAINDELVQIGGNRNKEDNFAFKKKILKQVKSKFSNEWDLVGGLSAPSKMPGYGYSTPASACITGAKLRKVEGSACYSCYAFRGNYPFPTVQNALHKRLYALNDPLWVPAMARLINEACGATAEPYFRWHDAGDLQGIWHLDLIAQVCDLTPSIKHWLPTREYQMITNHLNTLPSNEPVTFDSVVCQAYTREGFCGDCRKCWDKSIPDVSYPKH